MRALAPWGGGLVGLWAAVLPHGGSQGRGIGPREGFHLAPRRTSFRRAATHQGAKSGIGQATSTL